MKSCYKTLKNRKVFLDVFAHLGLKTIGYSFITPTKIMNVKCTNFICEEFLVRLNQ